MTSHEVFSNLVWAFLVLGAYWIGWTIGRSRP